MRKLLVAMMFCGVAAAQDMPDPKLTPGVARPELSVRTICATAWGKDHRAVTAAMKREVFRSYGFLEGNQDPRCPCEIDHLISRELGGADDVKNLWPQPYTGTWNARMKDRLENRLHKELCAGNLTLDEAQSAVKDWQKSYKHYFSE